MRYELSDEEWTAMKPMMGERRPEMVRNMSESIAARRIAPVEIIARKI